MAGRQHGGVAGRGGGRGDGWGDRRGEEAGWKDGGGVRAVPGAASSEVQQGLAGGASREGWPEVGSVGGSMGEGGTGRSEQILDAGGV